MMKLQTSNKINGANTKSNSKNTQARVKAVTSERKIVKIDSDQKMLGTTDPLQDEDVYKDGFDDKVKSSEQPPPQCVAVAVRDEENTMNSPRGLKFWIWQVQHQILQRDSKISNEFNVGEVFKSKALLVAQ